jgi:transposase
MPRASLTNWVRADAKGELGTTAGGKPAPVVTSEQSEIARLRAELARVKMERDIAKKAAAYFAQDVLQSTPGSSR